jgi:hypothetical protein
MTRPLYQSLQAATRLLLDSVSYSNPLPEWIPPTTVDYDAREQLLSTRADDYLSNRRRPKPGVPISVPRRDGSNRIWTIPTVNDQILLQTCALRLSHIAERRGIVDYTRVFSYEINRSPHRLAFTQDSLPAWEGFLSETRRRVGGRQILQFDIEQAYRSIDNRSFCGFFRNLAGDTDEVALLRVLLDHFESPPGLPFVNNALFYLGNVYLSLVDDIVHDHTDDFIRYVDDYRVFDDSRERLERIFAGINRDLIKIGFRINPRKTRVGDENDFITAVEAADRAAPLPKPGEPPEYNLPLVAEDVMEPEALAVLVPEAAKRVNDLTEGMGRYLMQSVRRMSDDPSFVAQRQQEIYYTGLKKNFDVPAANAALTTLSNDPHSEWRFVWLLYISSGLIHPYTTGRHPFEPFLSAVKAAQVTPIARCWLNRLREGSTRRAVSAELLHDMSYVEAGRTLYGSCACTGETL